MAFRAQLEQEIQRRCKIPVVQVLGEGGYNVLVQIDESTEKGIPVVVCTGTGRVADVIGRALECWNPDTG